MNCTSCGANLTPGVAICPLCGTPAPYNANPACGPPQVDPTVAASPYGGTPPPPNPYEAPPPQQQNFYGTPPPPQPGGMYGTQPPPKRRSRLGLILGIIAIVLIVACAGISFAVYQGLKQTGSTLVSSLDATATALVGTATSSTNTSGSPSRQTDPTTSPSLQVLKPPAP